MRAAGRTLTVGELVGDLLTGGDTDQLWIVDADGRTTVVNEVERIGDTVLLTTDDAEFETYESLLCDCLELLRELSDPKSKMTKERRSEITKLAEQITEETGIS